ncbi:VgrG-related protein [Actinacidiphila oryziradicis]|uniref:Type IV secretion protein Rhs n=1 Tax=Actinacidiphila oryziradicis TaxID=2571141 RepID=A0A4U0SNL2_9ACTN|nr:VgrG-related protein [Actinacidiphila oryziradicis]TKA11600.1 type IV secretion protein Rhs [Actinacidiphila oryziradicis]
MTKIGYSNVFSVKIAGKTLDKNVAPLLVAGWVDFGAGVPGSFQLTFRDQKKLVLSLTNADIGAKVELAAVSDGQGAQSPLLTGEITALETDYDATGTFTVIRGYDLGHRMLRQRRVVAYRNMTASDIARKLAGQDKVPVGTIDATKTVYEFITQANVNDWDFLARLADENEMVMSVSSRGEFQFVKPDPASGAPAVSTPGDNSDLVLEAGHDIVRCRVSVTSADQVGKVEARGWDVTTKKPLVGRSTAIGNPGIRIGITPATSIVKFGPATLVETDTPYDKQGEVKNAASALADDVTAAFAELEVTVRGNPKLRPGVPVALADVGVPFEGKYTVTGARHTFGDREFYATYLTVSGRQWRSLYGLASGGASTMPRLPSVANALVTDTKDPLRQGRVKLMFPWLDGTYVSDWTRSVQFGGVNGGGLITPEVDDEVLVAFDRGALDHPFVIGGLYNGKDKPDPVDVKPVDPTTGKIVRRTLSDRSGNRLDLLDQRTGTKRGVRLSTGNDALTINLDRTRTEITIDSKGAVTIKGTRSVSVEAGMDLSLKAGGNLSLKSGGILNMEASTISARSLGPFSVNAVSMLTLNTEGILEIGALAAATVNGTGSLILTSEANILMSAPNIAMAGGLITANAVPVI